MTRFRTSTAIVALLMASAPALSETEGHEHDGYYMGGLLGLNIAPDKTFDSDDTPLNMEDNRAMGFAGGLFFGHRTGQVSFELELAHRRNNQKDYLFNNSGILPAGFAGLQDDAGGHVTLNSLMANAMYHFDTSGDWEPYVGLGVGMARLNHDQFDAAGNGIFLDEADSAFAGQGILGIKRHFTEALSLFLSYRYIRTDKVTNQFGNDITRTAYDAHSVVTGISYRFGAKSAPQSKAEPAPVAQPTPVTNRAPTANDDRATVTAGESVAIDVLRNDRDSDGQIARVVRTSDASHGSVSINSDGSITYSANGDYAGPDSFTYTIADDDGAEDVGTVRIRVEPVTLPGPFLVFFDWDKSELREDAKQIIREAVSAFNQFGAASIVAVGHADRSGPDSYNLGLSRQRAAAVEAYLEELGVDTGAITTDAKGESEPLVETQDGVREPQNRRVEINLNR